MLLPQKHERHRAADSLDNESLVGYVQHCAQRCRLDMQIGYEAEKEKDHADHREIHTK
jgi:hypothetical protein